MRLKAGIVVLFLSLLVPVASAQAEPTKARIKIQYFTDKAPQIPVPGTWVGKMSSKKEKCHLGRTVTLYYKDGGENVEVGVSDTVGGGGRSSNWQIPQSDPPSRTYVAKSKATGKCAAAKSKPFVYPDDQPNGRAAARGGEFTKVKLTGYSFRIRKAGGAGTWDGSLKAGSQGCARERSVAIFRKMDGKDPQIDSGTSETDDNRFHIDAPKPKRGKYYAKVKAVQSCRAGKSNVFRYPQDQPL